MQVMTRLNAVSKTKPTTAARRGPRRLLRLAAAAACALAAVLATAAQADVREIGTSTNDQFPAAGCPSQCSVIARVTGYQAQFGTARNPFVVPTSGRIVAFTVKLGAPDANQLKYFLHNFGGAPEARIAVLKPVPHHSYVRLAAESEVFDLTNYLGSTPTFALATSVRVSAGSIIALTTPTWAPAFAIKRPTTEAWRSFRTHCNNNTEPAIHEGFGSARTYSCLYRGARLLYSATFVPNPTPTKRPSSSHGTTTTHR
jgi:hypothetical protein